MTDVNSCTATICLLACACACGILPLHEEASSFLWRRLRRLQSCIQIVWLHPVLSIIVTKEDNCAIFFGGKSPKHVSCLVLLLPLLSLVHLLWRRPKYWARPLQNISLWAWHGKCHLALGLSPNSCREAVRFVTCRRESVRLESNGIPKGVYGIV